MGALVPAEQRLAELHIMRARELALNIFSASTGIHTPFWDPPFSERVIIEVSEFAFHARRVHELCGFSDNEFLGTDFFLIAFAKPPNLTFLDNYKHCLNRLAHATTFKKVAAEVNDYPIKFDSKPPHMLAYFVVSTNNFADSAAISLVSITYCFISQVIPAVLKKYPGMNF